MEMPYKLEVLWCRTFQSVLKIGNYFMGYRMPKYLEGPGKIKELGAFLKEKGINDVLVVTGSGMVRRGQVQPMLDGFEETASVTPCRPTPPPTPPLTMWSWATEPIIRTAARPLLPWAAAVVSTAPRALPPRSYIPGRVLPNSRVC